MDMTINIQEEELQEILEAAEDVDAASYFNPYANSRPLDLYRDWTDEETPKHAIDTILAEIRELPAHKSGKKKLQRIHLSLLLVELFHNYLTNPEGYIGISLNNNKYGKCNAPKAKGGNSNKTSTTPHSVLWRYNPHQIAVKSLKGIKDALVELEYLEFKIGFHDPKWGDGYQSRIRAKQKLISKLLEFGIREEHINRHDDEPLIILKEKKKTNKPKKEIYYEDTEQTISWHKQLKEYNKLVARHHIDLAINLDYVQLNRRFDLSDKITKRKFSGNFEQGGRFYDPWWLGIPSALRRFITIDGEPTVEIDYKCLHIFMLYFMAGYDPNNKLGEHYIEDAYHLDGWDNTRELRNLVKKLLLTVINASGEVQAL